MATSEFSIVGNWQGMDVARVITTRHAPRFQPGELIWIDRNETPEPGDDVIVDGAIEEFDGREFEGAIVGRVKRMPIYWVARGVPIEVDGMRVTNHPVQSAAFFDVEEARVSLRAWKQVYPDAKIIEERPL